MNVLQDSSFTFKQETDDDSVFELLCRKYLQHKVIDAQLERQYLDSFDWRLYRNNLVCGFDRLNSSTHKQHNTQKGIFFVVDKKTGASICEFPVNRIPRFSDDITQQTCRKLLNELLGIRALITVASSAVKRRQLNILNQENKTILILRTESYTLTEQTDKHHYFSRLTVSPVKGYRKTFKQVRQYLIDQLKLPIAGKAMFDEILAASNKIPGPGVFTACQTLNDTHNTGEAVRILLHQFLEVMQANEPGLRDAIDTEFLHDYRVAVRRTRTLLGQIKHIFPAKQLDYFKREFLWLGQITGPTRDLDIYLLKFDDYRQELPKGMQNHLAPFQEFLERHWQIEHTLIRRKLDSKRYQKLIDKLHHILEDKDSSAQYTRLKRIAPQDTVNATKPVRIVAGKILWKLYKQVLKEGKAITPQSPDEDLHELRKSCKKFRYLIEFFQDYYPSKSIKMLLKLLKALQDNLGDFQDLCIQTTQLNHFAEQMQQEGLANTQTLMAMGVLVEKLNVRKMSTRAEFEHRFNAFTQPDSKEPFSDLFKPQHQPKGITI